MPEKLLSSHKKSCILLGVLFGVFSGQPPEQHGVAERVVSLKSVPFFLGETQFLKCKTCFVFRWHHRSWDYALNVLIMHRAFTKQVIWSSWKSWWQYCYCHENSTALLFPWKRWSYLMNQKASYWLGSLPISVFCCWMSCLNCDIMASSVQVCPKRYELSSVVNLFCYKGSDVLWSSQQMNNPARINNLCNKQECMRNGTLCSYLLRNRELVRLQSQKYIL